MLKKLRSRPFSMPLLWQTDSPVDMLVRVCNDTPLSRQGLANAQGIIAF